MSVDGIKVWLAEARRQLEECPPSEAQRIGLKATEFGAKLAEQIKLLEKELAEVQTRATLASIKNAELSAKKSGATQRWPKVWFRNSNEHSLDGVEKVEDNEDDSYARDGENWSLERGSDPYTFTVLVEDFSPIVEEGPDVLKVRYWVDEVREEFRFPLSHPVYRILDGEGDQWSPVDSEGKYWETLSRTTEDIQERGHFTLHDIAEETGYVMALTERSLNIPLVTWGLGDDEPHESFTYVRLNDMNLYFTREGSDRWYAPNVSESRMKDLGFSGRVISWDELIKVEGVVKEHRR